MNLHSLIKNGYGSSQDFNCAEKILYGANKVYNLGLKKESLKLSAGFGGGMGIESICGALTGAIMVLSHAFVKEVAHEGELIKNTTRQYLEEFKHEMSSIDCSILKNLYRTDDKKCNEIILKAAQILDKVYTETQLGVLDESK